jgi:hypothetical protein
VFMLPWIILPEHLVFMWPWITLPEHLVFMWPWITLPEGNLISPTANLNNTLNYQNRNKRNKADIKTVFSLTATMLNNEENQLVIISLLCLHCKNTVNCILYTLFYPMLSVSLDCPFWIAPSVFSNVYLCGTEFKL